ncbi:alpha/beta fold hydrolase [Galbibacter mesophilus]|uniref:alpha/beta fold hydrolase n=1 Tax=Galbibacter mesophilus TaxID=379069 RepID=UPI00191F5E6A|nr:alpha/beta fold hydrolase [Galbibacter mesophilus]MCM5664318.1 alpha/beta fold hydrolase [Galbibacter mesophilus]
MQLLKSKIMGEGKPLLILHGFLGMSDNWKTLGSQYAEEGFEVHLLDLRNHGRSFHSDDFSYELMVKDVLYYISEKNLGKVNIIGHSMGGKVAMLLAVSNPSSVEKLLIADIAPKYYPPHHQAIINGLQALDFSNISSRTEADEALAKHISDWGTRQFLLKNLYWKEKETLAFRFNLPVLSEAQEEIGEALPSQKTFDGNTLFLRGSKSEYISPNDNDLILNHFPKATIETVDNAGHWLHAENPKQFFSKSISFFK